MGQYTAFLEDKSFSIFEEDDYLEELKKAAEFFRTFDQALDTFLVEHGFQGDVGNAEEKVNFITDRMKSAGIPVPRNIKKWYSEHKTIERKTAFQICFAFQLKVEEVDDFFRRICLARGFDCHVMEEVVYFFAFKKGLRYQEVSDMMPRIRAVKPAKMAEEDIVYTDLIVEEIDEIETVEELVSYLNENADKFGYNNAAATESIRYLWKEIAEKNSMTKRDGIAIIEKKLLYAPFDKEEEEGKREAEEWEAEEKRGREKGDKEKEGEEKTDGEAKTEEKGSEKRKERKRADDSIWEIYLQILGLSGSYAADFYRDRSLKFILKDNKLLHPLAEASFPDRDGLNKILNGEHVSYERVRKMLILLAFYKFWAGRALDRSGYEAEGEDSYRCIAVLNNYLADAGYPMLYPGNPYDFLILFSVNSGYPLVTFRDYMREMFFAVKSGP